LASWLRASRRITSAASRQTTASAFWTWRYSSTSLRLRPARRRRSLSDRGLKHLSTPARQRREIPQARAPRRTPLEGDRDASAWLPGAETLQVLDRAGRLKQVEPDVVTREVPGLASCRLDASATFRPGRDDDLCRRRWRTNCQQTTPAASSSGIAPETLSAARTAVHVVAECVAGGGAREPAGRKHDRSACDSGTA